MLHRLNTVPEPASRPRAAYEPNCPADFIPAIVHDYSNGPLRVAAVTHSHGENHANARLTVERLRARGYSIVKPRGLAVTP